MKLGGWTRLFIVVSALWTLAVLVCAVMLRDSVYMADRASPSASFDDEFEPSKPFSEMSDEELRQWHRKLTARARERELLEPEKPTNSLGQQIVERIQRADRRLERGGVAPAEPDATTAKRLNRSLVATLAALWLLPLVALFAFGHAVGWVIRGFRRSAAPPAANA